MPKPLDTRGIDLSSDLNDLIEIMAKNVHEVWAAGRMAEGWTWAMERNDRLKHHPCLVPYEQLPENEKDYDRHTAVETLKLILHSGYRIEQI